LNQIYSLEIIASPPTQGEYICIQSRQRKNLQTKSRNAFLTPQDILYTLFDFRQKLNLSPTPLPAAKKIFTPERRCVYMLVWFVSAARTRAAVLRLHGRQICRKALAMRSRPRKWNGGNK
jgi:hypothetical protein